jgi:hypothetical protein
MYIIPPEETVQQGDIFIGTHFVFLEERNRFLINQDGVLSIVDEGADAGDLVIASQVYPFMAVSQTCDLQRKEFVSIAPIYELTSIGGNGRQASVRSHKVTNCFYLYPNDHFEESYVDFSKITSIPLNRLQGVERIVSLDLRAQHYLADRLKQQFGRPVQPPPPNYI